MSQEMTARKFSANEVIFKEGDAPDFIYLINKGTVEIYREISGKREVLNTLGWSKMFGEMAMVDKKPRTASAVAKEETWVYVITKANFDQKLKEMDPFMRSIIESISEIARNMSNRG
jgi:CRP-like cAMP-binding protein